MTSKTIQLYRKDNDTLKKSYRVRFYSSGCYTIIDEEGYEHEAGTWKKVPFTLDNGQPSRDKNSVYYVGSPFGKRKHEGFKLSDLAVALCREYMFTNA